MHLMLISLTSAPPAGERSERVSGLLLSNLFQPPRQVKFCPPPRLIRGVVFLQQVWRCRERMGWTPPALYSASTCQAEAGVCFGCQRARRISSARYRNRPARRCEKPADSHPGLHSLDQYRLHTDAHTPKYSAYGLSAPYVRQRTDRDPPGDDNYPSNG